MKIDLTKYDTLIFDFGGVILDINPDKTWNAFEKLISQKQIQQIRDSGLLESFEKGALESSELLAQINTRINTNLDFDLFLAAWNAMLLDYKPDRMEIIKQLKQTHRLFLLSNTNRLHYNFFSTKLKSEFGIGFSDLFEKTYVSHEMGLIKPDLEIYKKVLQEQKLIPERTLFIEDTQVNADAAQELGISTLVIPRNGSFYDYFL